MKLLNIEPGYKAVEITNSRLIPAQHITLSSLNCSMIKRALIVMLQILFCSISGFAQSNCSEDIVPPTCHLETLVITADTLFLTEAGLIEGVFLEISEFALDSCSGIIPFSGGTLLDFEFDRIFDISPGAFVSCGLYRISGVVVDDLGNRNNCSYMLEVVCEDDLDDCAAIFEIQNVRDCNVVDLLGITDGFSPMVSYEWLINGDTIFDINESLLADVLLVDEVTEICLTISDELCNSTYCDTIIRNEIVTDCNPSISGTIYIDENCNGIFDDQDTPFIGGLISFETTGTATDFDGAYQLGGLPFGDTLDFSVTVDPELSPNFDSSATAVIVDRESISRDFGFCRVEPCDSDNDMDDLALGFDGVDDFASRSGFGANGDLTISAWFRADDIPNEGFEDRIVSFGPSARMEIGVNNNGDLWLFDDKRSSVPSSYINVRDGLWHQVVVTRSGSNGEIFLDGVSVDAYVTNSTSIYGPNFSLGRWTGGLAGTHFKGLVDEVSVWDIALNSSDVSSLYECSLDGTEFGLVSLYKMDQGLSGGNNTAIGQVTDIGPGLNDLSFNNFALDGSISNFVCSGTGLSQTCSFCSAAPEASCHSDLTFTLNPMTLEVIVDVNDIYDGSSSNCGQNLTLSFDPNTIVTSITYRCPDDIGNQSITLYVSDANGKQSSCTTTIEIIISDIEIEGAIVCEEPIELSLIHISEPTRPY